MYNRYNSALRKRNRTSAPKILTENLSDSIKLTSNIEEEVEDKKIEEVTINIPINIVSEEVKKDTVEDPVIEALSSKNSTSEAPKKRRRRKKDIEKISPDSQEIDSIKGEDPNV